MRRPATAAARKYRAGAVHRTTLHSVERLHGVPTIGTLFPPRAMSRPRATPAQRNPNIAPSAPEQRLVRRLSKAPDAFVMPAARLSSLTVVLPCHDEEGKVERPPPVIVDDKKGEKQPTGRVVGIIKRNWRA